MAAQVSTAPVLVYLRIGPDKYQVYSLEGGP
jgi:hypothetical protein